MRAQLRRHGVWLAFSIALLAIGAWGYQRFYAGPMGGVLEEERSLRAQIEALEDASDDHFRVRTGLREWSATSLGGEADVVTHRFRVLLSELAAGAGLSDIVVDHGRAAAVASPLARAKIERSLSRAAKQRTDFAVLHGELAGVGPLDAVVAALARLEAQPWVHRVSGFSIKPADKDRATYELRAQVASQFVPGLEPEEGPSLVAVDEASAERLATLARVNPFVLPVPEPDPEPPPAPAVASAPVEPQTAPPAYDRWRLVGVVTGTEGVEVYMLNVRSGARRVMRPGDRLLGLRLAEAGGETAWYESDGVRARVRNGQTLDQREVVDRVH